MKSEGVLIQRLTAEEKDTYTLGEKEREGSSDTTARIDLNTCQLLRFRTIVFVVVTECGIHDNKEKTEKEGTFFTCLVELAQIEGGHNRKKGQSLAELKTTFISTEKELIREMMCKKRDKEREKQKYRGGITKEERTKANENKAYHRS